MPENLRTRMIEMSVIQSGQRSWEWRLYTGKQVHVCGFEATRVAARFAAYDSLIAMLAGGWT
jgi:primosomal replication protein N